MPILIEPRLTIRSSTHSRTLIVLPIKRSASTHPPDAVSNTSHHSIVLAGVARTDIDFPAKSRGTPSGSPPFAIQIQNVQEEKEGVSNPSSFPATQGMVTSSEKLAVPTLIENVRPRNDDILIHSDDTNHEVDNGLTTETRAQIQAGVEPTFGLQNKIVTEHNDIQNDVHVQIQDQDHAHAQAHLDPTLRDESFATQSPTQDQEFDPTTARPRFRPDEDSPWPDLPSFIDDLPHTHVGQTKTEIQSQSRGRGIDARTPWQLQTSFPDHGQGQGAGNDSLPPSSTSESPAAAGSPWTYEVSMTDLGSGIGTPGNGMSAASSESGYEPCEGVPGPKKKSHARKQPEGHIKRARNKFILFRKYITDSNLIPPSVEQKHQNISVVAAKMWKEAPPEVRARFEEQARIEKEEHQRKYPGYRYQPAFRRTNIIRRRVRKDPAEDEKVDAVAEALIKGKAGGELEQEVKDQLVKSDASESEAESSRGGSRRSRRRGDTGELSKGAIRAQRAQARAKQMRQNLLGSNLLSMSLYNAAYSRMAAAQQSHYPHHQGGGRTHPGMQYAMDQSCLPLGYGIDGQPLPPVHTGSNADYAADQDIYSLGAGNNGVQSGIMPVRGHENEIYRLPPIHGMMSGAGIADSGNGYDWPAQNQDQGMEYWDFPQSIPAIPPQQDYVANQGIQEDYYAQPYGFDNGVGGGVHDVGTEGDMGMGMGMGMGMEMEMGMGMGMEYRLPPLLETSRDADGMGSNSESDLRRPGDLIANEYTREISNNDGNQDQGVSMGSGEGEDDARLREWLKDGQQTPSGHVHFNERLFDGALGSADLGLGLGLGMGMGAGTGAQERREEGDDALGMFGEAMEQAGGIGEW
ncbi:hypothetical protein IAR55_004436 [Kwoniella newhampshirensis]|uniref:HMG box domain-containing protein n=1 Tax=Kwoniella newhampshirensis TaxID=1651941 RepID=A0AAW0YXB1_9TREE